VTPAVGIDHTRSSQARAMRQRSRVDHQAAFHRAVVVQQRRQHGDVIGESTVRTAH